MNKLMRWNWRGIRAVIRKDLLVVFKNKLVIAPMLLLPTLLMIALPLLVGVTYLSEGGRRGEIGEVVNDFERLILNAPASDTFFATLEDPTAQSLYMIYLYLFVPFFLILPVMTGSIIAADSFAGEKERKTLEALLHTPLSDFELYFAKWLSPLITSMVVSWGKCLLNGLVVNGVMLSGFGFLIFPNLAWVILLIWVVPAVTCMGLGVTVWFSSRVSTFQEAYQTGAYVIIPIMLLFIGQAGGIIYFDVSVSLLLGAVIWALDAFLFSLGGRKFSRGEVLSRLT